MFALQASALGFATWTRALVFALFDWGPWIVFSPLVLFLSERFPIGQKTWRWSVPTHLLACLLVVTVMEAIMVSLSLHRDFMHTPPPEPRHHPRHAMVQPEPGAQPPEGPDHPEAAERPAPPRPDPLRFLWFRFADRARFAIPIYWMLVAAAHAMAQQRRSTARERRALQAEALLAEARLMALQAQLNPHFLFNTLNAIAQLVYENPAGAEEMITSLSDLLRAALAAQNRREVMLDEEIGLLERYFAIQKVRFADRLSVVYDIDRNAANAAVPTLLLQPLAENAIKHGIAPDSTPGTVYVRIRISGTETLRIEISDTGRAGDGAVPAGEALEFRPGVGLANTRARLEALYPGRYVFALERAAEGGVLVRVELPLHRLSA